MSQRPDDPDHSAQRVQIKLHDINQLFNTMDPSPFRERDLDDDAEEFIMNWAREFPLKVPLVLTIHVSQAESAQQPVQLVEQAVQHYFSYRADLNWMEFRQLMRDGRISLIIGIIFLVVCLVLAAIIDRYGSIHVAQVSREGLTIAGWVAMWRPIQIYLYDWWPLRRRWKIFQKLSRMKVEIHYQQQ